MTIYKRIGSFLLSLLLVFSMFSSTFAIQTFAATSPALSAESKTVNAGEQFTVAVSLANATTVYGGNFTLQYDSSLLTADSYEFSSIVSGHTKNCNLNYQSAGNLIRVTFSGASAVTSSGTLITFTFTAKENVSGPAALQFNAYKMYDENGSAITSTANGSTITIATEPVVSPTLSITNKTVTEGSTVNVPIVISDSEAVYGGNYTLQYDSNLLTANSYTFGSIINGHTKNCNLDYQSAGNLIRVTFSGAEAISADGTLITLTFTAKTTGTASLKFNAYKMYDENGTSIDTTVSNGSVSIEPKPDIDTTNPTGSISSTNNVATSQTVTLKLSDDIGIAGYYWGTSNTYSNNTYTSTSSSSVTKTITSAGTYYLVVKDTSGNVSPSYPITFYKTTLNANGGSVSPSYVITKSGNTVTLPTPTNGDATFTGWGDSATATSGVKSITVSSAQTYYALWENSNIVSGQCGDNVYYKLNLDVMALNIYGTGTMWSYEHTDTPWEEYRENICEIVIENGVTSIGTSSFSGFSNLSDVEIATSVASIHSSAFVSCTSLSKFVIPDGVKYLGQYVFDNCKNIQYIYIPSSVTSTNEDSFGDLISLQEIVVSESNPYYYSVDGVLYGNSKLYKYPSASETTFFTVPNGIHTICWRAFSYSQNLTGIDLNSVTTIKSTAFEGCEQIESIDATNCDVVGKYAFNNCIGLKQVKLSATLPSIEMYTFNDCSSLVEIEIPDSVQNIGYAAFYGCSSLTDLTLPENLTYIDDLAFRCSNLRNVTILSKDIEFGENVFGYVSGSNFIGSDDLTLISYSDSNTEQYAEDNYIPFIALDGMTVENVSISSNPTKTTYYIGDSLSTSGLKLSVSYSDGTTETITSGFTTSGFSSITAGTKTVTVSYEGFTDTFTVTVKTPSITLSSSSKTMSIGDTSTITATTTPSGQTVTWTSSNTSVATISGGKITAKASGSTTITAKFTYNGKTYSKTCSVTVEDVPVPPTPESLSVSTKPTKTTYEIGESLNTSGLKLKLTYSDGTYETITSGFTTSGFSSTTAGTKTVAVKYSGLTTTFTVTVKEPEPDIDENAPQIVLESKKTTKGKEFTVLVTIKNNPGFSYLEVTPSHSSELTLVKVENGDLVSDFTKGKQYVWVSDEDVTTDGVLLTFTFSVDDSVEAGNYQINFNVRTCANYDEESVSFNVVKADIEVLDCVYGDATGDGKIDGFDVIRLKKYLANYDYDTESSSVEATAGADANGDGKIDGFDVIRLKKYLANYDYETGESTVVLGPQ